MDTLNQAKELFLTALEHQKRGELEQAESLYRKALELAPDRPSIINNLTAVLLQLKRYEEARSWCEKLLATDANNVAALINLGNCRLMLDSAQAALASYDHALAIDPDSIEDLSSRSKALIDLERPAEALASCDKALAIQPDYADALNNRGGALQNLKRHTEALASYDKVLALKPDDADALYNRGNVLLSLKRHAEALASFDQAIAITPDHAQALSNRGDALLHLAKFEEALASYNRSLAIKPDYAEVFSNRGNALQNLRRYQEALDSYGRALTLKPDHVDAHWNECLCRLYIGDFARGWEKYEWRWLIWQPEASKRGPSHTLWDGSYIDGALFVWGEQGLGDQILYAGMLDELRRQARKLVVVVERRLVQLFRRSFPGVEFIEQSKNIDTSHADVHVPMGSIGRYFRNRWEDFPLRRTGYLVPDHERAAGLRARLAGDGRLLVGLSWISKVENWGVHKSARLSDFEPILKLPGIRFVDLQYGDTGEERSTVMKQTGVEVTRVEDVDNFEDIDGLAALISACDVVVTISNTTAHIAGALGKPVYLLAPYALGTLWYWHFDRDVSPWYPTLRLFRQPANGDWASVIQRVAEELRA